MKGIERQKRIKKWYLNYEKAKKDCPKGYHIVELPGYYRFYDYYKVIKKGSSEVVGIPQSHAKKKYGVWDIQYYIGDWGFIPARRKRLEHFLKVKDKIKYDYTELYEYLQGHRTPREFYKKITNPWKERARKSHFLCDVGGIEGHQARQKIRRML